MRKSRTLLTLVGLIVIVAVVLVVVWTGATRRNSPKFCVEQVIRALRTRDSDLFAKHVDIESFAASVVDQIFDLDGANLREEEAAKLSRASGGATKDVLRPMMYVETKRTLQVLVKEGPGHSGADSAGSDQARLYFGDIWSRLLGTDTCYAGVDSISGNDMESSAVLRFTPQWGTACLEVQMTKKANNWKVVGLHGLNTAVQQFNLWERTRVDSINADVERQIAENLTLEEVEVENRWEPIQNSRIRAFTVHSTVSNKFHREIRGLDGALLFHFSSRGKWCFGRRERQYTDTTVPLRLGNPVAAQSSFRVSVPISVSTKSARGLSSIFGFGMLTPISTTVSGSPKRIGVFVSKGSPSLTERCWRRKVWSCSGYSPDTALSFA